MEVSCYCICILCNILYFVCFLMILSGSFNVEDREMKDNTRYRSLFFSSRLWDLSEKLVGERFS